jgi:hypothetical protein
MARVDSLGMRALLVATLLCIASAPPQARSAQSPSGAFFARITDDRPGTASCTDPLSLPIPTPDVNNQPQAEVSMAVSEDGRLAATAKDYRYSPLDDTTYNRRVWNGLYLSDDAGASWRNLTFEAASPIDGISGLTTGAFGQAPGQRLRLTHQTDPVAEFDRDGNVYTCALAFEPDPPDRQPGPSASGIVVSRWDASGRLAPGTTHFIGLESDARLFNDKNWLAVDRTAAVSETVVVASWRLFTYTEAPPALEGGYVAVSADGAASFGSPIHLPIPAADVPDSQFYQPLIGPDPQNGRKTLYVFFRTVSDLDRSMALHLIKADIAGLPPGTAALHARLEDPASWRYLPNRITGLYAFGSEGWGGSFRFASFFMPAIDRDTGHLYTVADAFEPRSQLSRVIAARSTDGGASWTPPRDVDAPGRGYQIMPTLAYHSGTLSVLWYDSRNDPEFAPLAPIRGLDVYYAELDAQLNPRRLLRLTPETQRADRPVFTRPRPVGSQSQKRPGPHDVQLPPVDTARRVVPQQAEAMSALSTQDCVEERYGFIGDYIGLAADRRFAYAGWCDLRDLVEDADVCAGHSCNGRRNQNVYFARIPKD